MLRKTHVMLIVTCLTAVIMTACGAAGPGRITIAAIDTPEHLLASEILALWLEESGFEVYRPGYAPSTLLSSSQELAEAMQGGYFDVSLIFAQDALWHIFGEPPVSDLPFVRDVLAISLQDMYNYILLEPWSLDGRWNLGLSYETTQGRTPFLEDLPSFLPTDTISIHPEMPLEPFDDFGLNILGTSPGNAPTSAIATRNGLIPQPYLRVRDTHVLWPQNDLHPIAASAAMVSNPMLHPALSAFSFQTFGMDDTFFDAIEANVGPGGSFGDPEQLRQAAQAVLDSISR